MPASTSNHWLAVDQIACRQHGLITTAQLRERGFTPAMIRTALTAGRLSVTHPGIYRSVGSAASTEQRLLAAVLRAGEPASASHRSGGWLWSLIRDTERVEILVPEGARTKPKNVTVHRSADFDPNHFTTKRGIPVTKPARTIVDLAAVLAAPALAEVVDRALVTGLVSQAGLRAMIGELARSGREGPPALRRVLDDHPLGGHRPESVIESVMANIVRHSAVADRIVYQHVVTLGRQRFRLDFAAPHVKAGIEVLGLREHGTRQAVIDDSERRRLLRLAGWDLIEYTKTEMSRAPRRVADEISRFIEDRERMFAALGLLA